MSRSPSGGLLSSALTSLVLLGASCGGGGGVSEEPGQPGFAGAAHAVKRLLPSKANGMIGSQLVKKGARRCGYD